VLEKYQNIRWEVEVGLNLHTTQAEPLDQLLLIGPSLTGSMAIRRADLRVSYSIVWKAA